MSIRYLNLFRHGSAEASAAGGDFKRPLKKKGIQKAAETARIMTEKGYKADLIISSAALRAVQTAETFAAASVPEYTSEIIKLKSLYLPSTEELFSVVAGIEPQFRDVFIFSHNNGISAFAGVMSGRAGIIMPAGSVVRIGFDIDSWNEAGPGSGELAEFLP